MSILTFLELLVLLLIAGTCGAIGEAICGYSIGGFLVAMVLGFVGAAVGIWLASVMALPAVLVVRLGGAEFPVVWAIIGATLAVAVIRLISRRSVYY